MISLNSSHKSKQTEPSAKQTLLITILLFSPFLVSLIVKIHLLNVIDLDALVYKTNGSCCCAIFQLRKAIQNCLRD